MKRLLLSILLLTMLGQVLQAQKVRSFEGEFRLGATAPLGDFHNGKKKIGPSVGFECRYNFEHVPLDIGLSIETTSTLYGFHPAGSDSQTQNNSTFSVALLSDYNFNQGNKVNPYIGMGLGLCSNHASYDVVYDEDKGGCVFIPRVGIELYHHLRFSLYSHISRKGYNNICFSIGVVFGGGVKK